MKLARDSWLLYGVPAGVLLVGAWWFFANDFGQDHGRGAVRFEVSEHDDRATLVGPARNPPADSSKPVGVIADDSANANEALEPTAPAKAGETTPWGIWIGRVIAKDGTPLKDASVLVTATRRTRLGDGTFLGDSEEFAAVIGKNGEVVFEMKPGFRYELSVRAPGYGLEKVDVQSQISHDLVLDRASKVDGRVMVQGTGKPLAGATVTFQNGNERYDVTTDEEGRFEFDGVGARPAHVMVTDNRYVAQQRAIDGLRPGGSVPVNLFVEPGSLLAGEVVSEGAGNPVSDLEVTLLDRLTHEIVARGTTDVQGRFRFSALIPRREYFVGILGAGWRTDRPTQIFSNGDSVTLTVSRTWTLRVQLGITTTAAPGVSVFLTRHDGLPLAGNQTTLRAVSDAHGVVSFGQLSRDLAYRVVIANQGIATMEFGPVLAGQGDEQVIPFELTPARALGGRVVDGMGQPVPFVTVRAQRVDGIPAPPLFVQADATGTFMFDSLAPGAVSLVTFRAGYDNARTVVEVPADGPPPMIDLTMPMLVATSSGFGNFTGQ